MWRPRTAGRSRKLQDCKAWRKKSHRLTTTATNARSAGRASIRPSLPLHRSWTSRRPKLRDSILQNPSASIRLHHNCPTLWGLSYPSRVAEAEPDAGESSYIRGASPDLSQKMHRLAAGKSKLRTSVVTQPACRRVLAKSLLGSTIHTAGPTKLKRSS
jgi:hypothetical protein